MARFDVEGMDEIIRQMKAMGEMTGQAAAAMLMAGAKEVQEAWREAAEEHGHRDTGQMIESIGFAKRPKTAGDMLYIDIYPQGKNSGGVRNAEVAFVLHYGTSKMPGSGWIDDADRISGPRVTSAMETIWAEFLATGKVPMGLVNN